ncbi:MBOAT family O-acyltransferase [Polaribacter sargassicola]|uniref:MBOAT family O-acyltransferase n=1 Tax=Polaribacter sargassicola TaxID=2836891 RepID=UPI001F2A803D|nr:MBOAT family O-acyltransferase [Polaribacter sp. DS7-9]MCG1034793.1 MBOAT family protein [Polaribacter sp. DS7-9]
MLFNSIDFAIFLPIVFVLYWFITNKNLKLQNFLIVVASYLFYGWWDWKFLSLILFSTLVDYSIGRGLLNQENASKRKVLLWLSIVVNLGFLGFFKYYNFFIDNFTAAFTFFGMNIKASSLNIVLPVGISFYTFQTLSYSIDVYKRKLEPTKDFIAFAAFVSFFPQLVAGPIERATNLIPQILNKRKFDKIEFINGIKLIIYGFFLKIFIADTLAPIVNDIFNNYENVSGGTLILGAIFFSFQIYGDFGGYSKIARGTSMLFGFNLMENFNFPYFSRNIGEFWRRWHISLNTWFRDYLYIPLGGSRKGKYRSLLNISIIFLVSGFWHGANWTFIVWGALHSLLFIPIFLSNNNRKYLGPFKFDKLNFDKLRQLFGILSTYILVTFAWIFFRSDTITDAVKYIQKINFNFDNYLGFLWIILIGVIVDILIQFPKYNKLLYPLMIGAFIAAAFSSTKSEFIYFQF